MIPPSVVDDVASLRAYRLDLLPDPVTPVDQAVPPRPMHCRQWQAPAWKATGPPVAEINRVLATLENTGRMMGMIARIMHDEARQAAAESRRRILAGEARELEGLAFGVKDVIQVAGSPTTFGSPAYAGFVPAVTAQAVLNLRDAGAILVAKLATYEFASGPNSFTRNVWDERRRSGGSSSGSAAAVGGGLLQLALGSSGR